MNRGKTPLSLKESGLGGNVFDSAPDQSSAELPAMCWLVLVWPLHVAGKCPLLRMANGGPYLHYKKRTPKPDIICVVNGCSGHLPLVMC